eukprot:TRINITY_DN76050_c0_g1_i1.p3 TRINITY_DN76050_c0_g1~~TRINITY_DN76050_c0_g1_i1.p3  ORF type:complete len:142 (+),score=1.27 TRINITY_DN76050_c0_g1_i1:3-428(+)
MIFIQTVRFTLIIRTVLDKKILKREALPNSQKYEQKFLFKLPRVYCSSKFFTYIYKYIKNYITMYNNNINEDIQQYVLSFFCIFWRMICMYMYIHADCACVLACLHGVILQSIHFMWTDFQMNTTTIYKKQVTFSRQFLGG